MSKQHKIITAIAFLLFVFISLPAAAVNGYLSGAQLLKACETKEPLCSGYLLGFATGWGGAATMNYMDSRFRCHQDPSKACVSPSARTCIALEVPYDSNERYQDRTERMRLVFINWARAYKAANPGPTTMTGDAAFYAYSAFQATWPCQKRWR